MPEISQFDLPDSFLEASKAMESLGDKSACAIIAISILTGVCPLIVYEICELMGRVKNTGTKMFIIERCIELLGFHVEKLDAKMFISTYPKPHSSVLRFMTTHHPRRFPKSFQGENLLLVTHAHAAAVKDGKLVDWSINRILFVHIVWRVKDSMPVDRNDDIRMAITFLKRSKEMGIKFS